MTPEIAKLIARLRELNRRNRMKTYRQKKRAEYWKARALRKGL